MTIQEQFNALVNYNTNTILDTDFKAYSKVDLFFLRIFSVLCCCFGVEFPDCEMGDVAKKVHGFASKNTAFFNTKSAGELSDLEGQINNLKIKADRKEGAQEAVTTLGMAAKTIGFLRDQKLLETSKDHLIAHPEIIKDLNALPPVEKTVDSTQISFKSDYAKEGTNVHYSREFPCTYQFGTNEPTLKLEGGVQRNLTARIKQLFNRSDKGVTEDPLLRTIFSYLGVVGCADLDYTSQADLDFSTKSGIVPGGIHLAREMTPHRFTFVPSPDNPNQATIQTESDCVLCQGDQNLYLKLCNTITITQNPENPDQCSVSIQRYFELLK